MIYVSQAKASNLTSLAVLTQREMFVSVPCLEAVEATKSFKRGQKVSRLKSCACYLTCTVDWWCRTCCRLGLFATGTSLIRLINFHVLNKVLILSHTDIETVSLAFYLIPLRWWIKVLMTCGDAEEMIMKTPSSQLDCRQ